jgi:hypothetical protein
MRFLVNVYAPRSKLLSSSCDYIIAPLRSASSHRTPPARDPCRIACVSHGSTTKNRNWSENTSRSCSDAGNRIGDNLRHCNDLCAVYESPSQCTQKNASKTAFLPTVNIRASGEYANCIGTRMHAVSGGESGAELPMHYRKYQNCLHKRGASIINNVANSCSIRSLYLGIAFIYSLLYICTVEKQAHWKRSLCMTIGLAVGRSCLPRLLVLNRLQRPSRCWVQDPRRID